MEVQTVEPEDADAKVHVVLDQQRHLDMFQSKTVKASTNNTSSDPDICMKMVTPNNKLARYKAILQKCGKRSPQESCKLQTGVESYLTLSREQ